MKPRLPLPPVLGSAPFAYADGLQHVGAERLRGLDLAAPYRGTRVTKALALDVEGRCRALATRMPRDGFFSSITAAELHRLPLPPRLRNADRIHVAVPLPTRATQTNGVVGHAVTLMGGDSVELRGLPVASVCRTWCELAAVIDLHDLVAVGDHIIHWRLPLASWGMLAATVARYPGRRGRRRLMTALPRLSDRAESPPESRLRSILIDGGVTDLHPNHWVAVGGRRLRIDIAIPRHRVAIEYQGEYHLDQGQRRRDMTRASILASDRWTTLEFNADDLLDPDEVVRRVNRTLRARES